MERGGRAGAPRDLRARIAVPQAHKTGNGDLRALPEHARAAAIAVLEK